LTEFPLQLKPGWNALFVSDWSGNYIDANGSSSELSNSNDRETFLRLRKSADAIVTTGATVRSEKYTKVSYAPIYILSASGSIPDSNLGKVLSFAPPIFDQLTQQLKTEGHEVFFYEGGPSILKNIEQTDQPITIWLTLVGPQTPGGLTEHALQNLGFNTSWRLLNTFQDGPNLVTQWHRP
jgi:riboflavin biosynthesis pyrimidine reductase